jgi:hypothetical protein
MTLGKLIVLSLLGCTSSPDRGPDSKNTWPPSDSADPEDPEDTAAPEDTGTAAPEDTGTADEIAVAGDYEDNREGMHRVLNSKWELPDLDVMLSRFDNEEHSAIGTRDSSTMLEEWVRIEWTTDPDEELRICALAGLTSEAEAEAADSQIDPLNLETGCGAEKPWLVLRDRLDIRGLWADRTSGQDKYTPFIWIHDDGTGPILRQVTAHDNADQLLVGQNSDGSYWRVDWTMSPEPKLYSCQSVESVPTEDAALASTGGSDPVDLETGCGGTAWTALTEALEIAGSYLSPELPGWEWQVDASSEVTLIEGATHTGTLVEYDNTSDYLIVQYEGVSPLDPDWTSRIGMAYRIDWTILPTLGLSICQTSGFEPTIDEARADIALRLDESMPCSERPDGTPVWWVPLMNAP